MKFHGKAGSLKFLESIELNVPDFTIITHEEFTSWGDGMILQKLYQALLQGNEALAEQEAKAFIQSVKIPEARLLNRTEHSYYAVRSSASVEDSPDNSFAGIFETKLFVADHLEQSIKEVWGSLFSPKALHYCRDRKIPWNELQMNIVVQAMISGEKSGVLFQADPMGKISEQIIVAGWGLGQGIVDEETDTDKYIIENYEIKESLIHHKEHQVIFENDKLSRVKVPEAQSNISTLSQNDIEKLLSASMRLSTYVNHFMDIEFTFKGSELYILQARPITTIPSKKNIHVFDNSNIAENYPGQSTPLTYTGLARGYAANFKNLIRWVGVKENDWGYINNNLDNLIGYWGGQIYYNLNNWYAVYTLLPFGGDKAATSFNEMVGIRSEGVIQIPERSLPQKLLMTARLMPKFLSYYFLTGYYHRQYTAQFKKLYERFKKDSFESKSIFEIIHALDRIDNDYLAIIKIPLFNDFFSSILNRSCRLLALRLNEEKGEQLYNDLLSHREELESSKAIYSLIHLATMVRENPELAQFLKEHSVSTIHSREEFRSFSDALEAHFDRFGDRSQWEMKIEVPTAREIPQTTIKLILEYASADMSEEAQRTREKDKSDNARNELKLSFSKKPLTYLLFKILFAKCTQSLCFREDTRFNRVRFKGVNRRLVLKLGEELVKKKWLVDRDDVFYLTYDEIMSLVHDAYGAAYWKELVVLRKKALKEYEGLILPDRIITNDLVSARKFTDTTVIQSSNTLHGIPCSGGLIEAECEVVTDLNSAPSLQGKILVAQRTDPSWGYFFVGVKGIIIEKGSMLSHAAIISRELGIPCIINVKGATELLRGKKVKLNGDTGEITVLR